MPDGDAVCDVLTDAERDPELLLDRLGLAHGVALHVFDAVGEFESTDEGVGIALTLGVRHAVPDELRLALPDADTEVVAEGHPEDDRDEVNDAEGDLDRLAEPLIVALHVLDVVGELVAVVLIVLLSHMLPV